MDAARARSHESRHDAWCFEAVRPLRLQELPAVGLVPDRELVDRRQCLGRPARDVAARVAGRHGLAERAVVARRERRDTRRLPAVGPARGLHEREQDAGLLERGVDDDAVGRSPVVGRIGRIRRRLRPRPRDARPVDVVADDVRVQLARQRPRVRLRRAQEGVVLDAERELRRGRRRQCGEQRERDEEPPHPGTVARMRRSVSGSRATSTSPGCRAGRRCGRACRRCRSCHVRRRSASPCARPRPRAR